MTMSRARLGQGDPGLFGFLGKVGKAALGGATGFLTGGIGGAVTGAAAALRSSPAAGVAVQRVHAQLSPGLQGTLTNYQRGVPVGRLNPGAVAQLRSRGLIAGPGMTGLNLPFRGPAGAGINTPAGRLSAFEAPMAVNGKPPAGWHWNKTDYFLRDGTFVPAGSKLVKNRRRNPLNPRALRRAVGRIDAGKVWQSKMRGIETEKFTKAGSRKSCN